MKKGIETTSLTTVIATRYFATFEAAVEYAQNTKGVYYNTNNIGKIAKHPFLATAWIEETKKGFELNVECVDVKLAETIDQTMQQSTKDALLNMLGDAEQKGQYMYSASKLVALEFEDDCAYIMENTFGSMLRTVDYVSLRDIKSATEKLAKYI